MKNSKCISALAVLGLFAVSSISQAQNRDSLDTKAEEYIRAQDFQHAVPILQEAASLGSSKSQYNYAFCLLQGAGVKRNDSLANVFLEKAAIQNNINAQYKLAHSYRTGRGVAPNTQKAIYWYTQAAELGDLESQMNVATYYDRGEGIPRDTIKMLYWLTRAATQRNPKDDTIAHSAILVKNGDTVISATTAVGYENSTEITVLRYQLASMYLAGKSVPKDSLKAYVWMLITNENKKDFPVSGKVAQSANLPSQVDLIDQVKFLETRLSAKQQKQAERDAAALLGRPLKNLAQKFEWDLD
jgi:TPR repeat protein